MVPIGFRPYSGEDIPFVYDSWSRSYRWNSNYVRAIPAKLYYHNQKHTIFHILKNSTVVMACNPLEPDQVYGYIVFQPTKYKATIIHYVYVKSIYRMFGIADALFKYALALSKHEAALPTIATHITFVWHQTLRQKWGMVFNPYLLGDETSGIKIY